MRVLLISVLTAAIIAFITVKLAQPDIKAPEQKESAFARVMRTNILRCGYVILPPEFERDPNTGKFGGIAHDLAEELGKRLNLKIEWTEEVNFATIGAAMEAGRFDAFCFTSYRYSPLARVMDYSLPVFYTATGVYVRSNDHRFDNNFSAINDPAVTLATIDGEMSQFIARDDFPNAKTLSLPQSTPLSDMLQNVVTNKADVAFSNSAIAAPYLVANPGQLRNIAVDKPIRVFGHGFGLKAGEHELKAAIDIVFAEMLNDGTVEKILARHEKAPGSILRAMPGYKIN
ncbi:MAG: substrate-binding periplasmic protein [Dongiaceae bacterium]